MRIDKYLKITRLIKRRTISKEIIDCGLVKINGKIAKPSSEIKVDDIITLHLGNKTIKIRVTKIQQNCVKEETSNLYDVLSNDKEL